MINQQKHYTQHLHDKLETKDIRYNNGEKEREREKWDSIHIFFR